MLLPYSSRFRPQSRPKGTKKSDDTTQDQKPMDYTQNISDDILSSVFSYLITPTAVLPPISGDPRLRLMTVSPRWRRIILESSDLWDTIVILPSSPVLTPGLAKIAEKWLKVHWKKGHFLSVFLLQPRHLAHINRPRPRNCNRIFRIVEDGILPLARGTTSFSCTLSTGHGIGAFFTIPPESFYGLERLELAVPLLPDQDLARGIKTAIQEELRHFTAFQRLPRLRTAVIAIKNGIHPLAFRIPWRQLTKLDMINTTVCPHIFLEVLSASAPSLEDGSFTIQFEGVRRSNSSAPKDIFCMVKLRFLQHLHLRLINPDIDTCIFSRLHLRALSHLKIELDDSEGWMMSIFQDLLSKSRKTLKSLGFWDAPLQGYPNTEMEGSIFVYNPPRSQLDLEVLFSMLPNLEDIRLPIGVYIPPNTADKIARGILLSSLRILKVSSIIGIDILDMVRRRNELAYHRPGWIGSSESRLDPEMAIGTDKFYPFFLHVQLLTSSANCSKVELAKKYLRSSSSYQGTAVDIRYAKFAV